MWRIFWCLLKRDLRLALRRRGDVLMTLCFFLIVVSLFPLGIGAEARLLRAIGPGVLWVAALLAALLALERLYAADYADGTLEQMLLAPQPLALLVLAKTSAHWLLTGLPLVLIAPLVIMQYRLPAAAGGVAMLALLLGTPVLGLIGSIGAALTLGLRGGGVLLSLLMLPLYIPVLVYGSGAIAAGQLDPTAAQPFLALLGAFLLAALALAPAVSAVALRISLE